MLLDQSVKCLDIEYRIHRYCEVIGVKKICRAPPPPRLKKCKYQNPVILCKVIVVMKKMPMLSAYVFPP